MLIAVRPIMQALKLESIDFAIELHLQILHAYF